jgi:hypothetical protein
MQCTLQAQNYPSLRWEPTLSFSKKVDTRWGYNFTVRARQRITEYGEGESNFSTDRWDAIAAGSYSLLGGKKLGLSYLFRTFNPFETESGFEHRLTQQFAFLTKFGRYRIGNKFMIEERIRTAGYETRLRYGISTDFPLQGQKLDAGEFYLITGNELVYAFNNFSDQLENRFSLGIGKLLKNSQKFQLIFESRYNDLISKSSNHILQIKSVYYFNW